MSQQTGQKSPPYSEEQVTRWLAFLARGMTEHDETIFLMEKLQPSWLSARGQRWVYILGSRLVWGIMAGLVLWLIIGLFVGLVIGLRGGLIFGFGSGLYIAVFDIIRFSRHKKISTRIVLWRRLFGGFIMVIMLVIGLIVGLTSGSNLELRSRLMFGLFAGLFFSLNFLAMSEVIWESRGINRGFENEIETVETIRFSWIYQSNGFKTGLVFGVTGGLTAGLLTGLLSDSSGGLRATYLLVVLISGLVGGLIGGLLNCFRPTVRESKTTANQGIWLSAYSASLMGSIGGLTLGVAVGLLGGWTNGLGFGIVGGLCIGLWYGGLDVIQHFLVRFLLWRSGSLPWRLAPFLDYAAEELHFLQKVGGGYIFVHRYLLEHFAAMETDDGKPRTADRQISDAG